MSLASRQCVSCRGDTPPVTGHDITELHRQLDERWDVIDEHHLTREFAFEDFAKALSYVNRVAEIAEEQGHHPDIYLSWGKVRVKIWTHKIDGLSESDFILAAKIDALRQA